jgi:hypothetical protein
VAILMSVAMQDNRRPDKICVIRRKTFSSDIATWVAKPEVHAEVRVTS